MNLLRRILIWNKRGLCDRHVWPAQRIRARAGGDPAMVALLGDPFNVISNEPMKTDLDDLLFDYILSKADKITYFTFSDEEIKILKEAGFDLNIDNWMEVKCPYLPFVHYLYVPGSWII